MQWIEGNVLLQDIFRNPVVCASAYSYQRAGDNEIKDVTLGFRD